MSASKQLRNWATLPFWFGVCVVVVWLGASGLAALAEGRYFEGVLYFIPSYAVVHFSEKLIPEKDHLYRGLVVMLLWVVGLVLGSVILGKTMRVGQLVGAAFVWSLVVWAVFSRNNDKS